MTRLIGNMGAPLNISDVSRLTEASSRDGGGEGARGSTLTMDPDSEDRTRV